MGLSRAEVQTQSFPPEMTKLDECLNPLPAEENGGISAPGPVLLLGMPGVGKGTQADILARLWRVPKISTGDILRSNLASGTKLSAEAEKIMKRGGLVPNQIMTEMISDRLSRADTAAGFILDGFPRNIPQAQWLDGYLSSRLTRTHLAVISMAIDLERVVERIIHRRVCPVCKSVYNTQLMPPKRAGKCDLDGSRIEQRSDDRLEVFQTRIAVFKRETEPLIRYYRGRPRFIEVDAQNQPSEVTRAIISALEKRRTRMDG